MQTLILNCLRNEVKPATGCTEPVAIALAAAHAAKAVQPQDPPYEMTLLVSTSILKNAMNVGVPCTKRTGLEIAVALGLYSDPNQGLRLLTQLDEAGIKKAHDLHDQVPILVKRYEGPERIYIGVTLKNKSGVHHAVISDRHDRLTYYSVNDEIYYQNQTDLGTETADYVQLYQEKIITILETIDGMSNDQVSWMADGYQMNYEMAKQGLKNRYGLGLGAVLFDETSPVGSKDLITLSMQLTAAASDARMSGVNLPVMTSSGSGNNGITAVLPIVAADIIYQYAPEKVNKALAISHVINSYIKHYLGRLSAVCACGVASATGAAMGIAYLMDMPLRSLPHIIDTMIANLSGMVCDGAKLGCSLKLSTASAAAIQSVYLLKHGSYADMRNGIVGPSPEVSIRNLALLANHGMYEADNMITQVLLSKINA